MRIHSHKTKFNADSITPVQLYLHLRNKHRMPSLLESNDYHSRQNSKSIIGLDPLFEITLEGEYLLIKHENKIDKKHLKKDKSYAEQVQLILNQYSFQIEENNGFFGRVSFEFTMKDECNTSSNKSDLAIPSLHLFLYKIVVIIDHYTNEGTVIENSLTENFSLDSIKEIISPAAFAELPFEVIGNERAALTDQKFSENIEKALYHCQQGDVFQLVISNSFQQPFFGDDFQVYRQLRRLNPSPYLFYFDFENYRLMGSSPEAQLVIKNGKAEIHPIAGTVPKTGIKETDDLQKKFLLEDEKENAEHTMLVDLARNDLSRNCTHVKVESYKEIQEFSHVTHLVSKVTGELLSPNSFRTLCSSFPAGTLSGTPKPRALELIQKYDSTTRDYYGGAIGMIGANGDLNMAIVIRSILSKNNQLHYRAGAGIVLDSNAEREVQEIHHKLNAIRTAIDMTHASFNKTINEFK